MRSIATTQKGIEKALRAAVDKKYSQKEIISETHISRGTVSKFFNGTPIKDTNFFEICKCLDLNWEEVGQYSSLPADEDEIILEQPYKTSEPKPSTSLAIGSKEQKKGSKNPMLSSTYTQKFLAWIENKTRRFVGRKYVFNAFEDFIKQHKKGYFSVIGEPGEGKSTIVAKYVLDNPCAYYFNSRRLKYTSTAQFLEYICKQLIDHYKLELSFTADRAKDGTFLQELLAEISSRLQNNEKLVIVVDALDEADLIPHQKEGSIALYLPEEDLPEKIYFLLTWRRDKNIKPLLPSPSNVPSKIFDLGLDEGIKDKCDEDIQEYIISYLKEVEISNELKTIFNNSKSQENKFLNGVTYKSKQNFMYLTLVLPEMVYGAYKDLILEELKKPNFKELKLRSLPDDLNRYYKDHWIRMGMISDKPPLEKIYIIYVMSENGHPMSRSLIAKYSGQKETIVQWILDHWDQFLEAELLLDQKDPNNAPLGYAFYHETYNDFLYSQEIIQGARIDLKKLNAEVAKRQVPPDIEW